MEYEYTEFNDSRLQYFKSKTQAKGETTFEKFSSLIQRWEKVIEDCEKSLDKSIYRVQFGEAHKLPLATAKMYFKDLKPSEESEVTEIVLSLKKRAVFYLNQTLDGSGASDALFFIVAELDHCL